MPNAFEFTLLLSLIAGFGVALIAGVFGCFVVWRRMAYFGDSLAHSALLGIALGTLTGIGAPVGTVVIGACFALLLVWLQHKRVLATDTLLGILAHSSLSIGMVTLSILHSAQSGHEDHAHSAHFGKGEHFDIHAALFGNILTVSPENILWLYLGGGLALILILRYWQPLLLMTLNEDLAHAEGIKTFRLQLMFMFLMTLVVAVSIRIEGILLITSLMIIPAATARQISKTPEKMAIASVCFALLAVLIGIGAALHFNTPPGPSVIAAAAAVFALTLPITQLRKR